MSSGSYSALSGNLAKMQAMETIIHNLANSGTAGYKKDRHTFAAQLSGIQQTRKEEGINYSRIGNTVTDFSQGTIRDTHNPLDFAIDGEGFFKVQGEEGIYFTRQGQFHLDNDGNLLTSSGHLVLGEKNTPVNFPNPEVTVDEEGRIFDGGEQLGRLAVFSIDDTSLLQKVGKGLFVLPSANAREFSLMDRPRVLQGYSEGSNVNVFQEMALMMENMRTFEAYQRVLKTYKDLADKANEVGTF